MSDVTADASVDKVGDRRLYLRPNPSLKDFETFTFGNNSMDYRPGLPKGSRQTLDRTIGFPLGIVYTVQGQLETARSVTSYYAANIASVAMVAMVRSTIKYDSSTREITYRFEGNGVDDVECVFKTKQ